MDTLHLDQTLNQLITPLLEERGIELVELAVSGGRHRKLVRLFVDRPEGITIGECASLSREIGDLFDTHDPISGGYVLEVSSPGLTRPLKTDSDFERVVGKALRLVVNGLGEQVGTLLHVNPEHLDVDLDGEHVAIDRAQIQKATLHFEL